MVGEIITGAVAGVAQSVGSVAMEAPVVAQTAITTATEVATPVVAAVTEGTTVGMGIAEEVAFTATHTISPVVSSAINISEAVAGVQEEVGTTLLAESMAESLVGKNALQAENLAAQLEGLFSEGQNAGDILEGLSDGVLTGKEFVSTETLLEEAQRMGEMRPGELHNIFGAVDRLAIPQEMLDDPTFRQDVAQELLEEAKMQKEQVTQQEDVTHMMEKSVANARAKHESRQKESAKKQTDPEELERLKKRAAMEAVRKQMEVWRDSVKADKRLTSEAKDIAMQKINKVEARLLFQTQMQWEGKSLLKMAAVAALWLAE